MISDFEFACMGAVVAVSGLSFFYNAKRGYYYLNKVKSIAFIFVLSAQFAIALLVKYLEINSLLCYLIPFNIYYLVSP